MNHELAVSIATAILSEAGCRKGIGAALDACDVDERIETIEAWAGIIERGVEPALRAKDLMNVGMITLVDRIDELEAKLASIRCTCGVNPWCPLHSQANPDSKQGER